VKVGGRYVILEGMVYDIDGGIKACGGSAEIKEGSVQDGR
jgi:hypothetical protein